MLICDYHLIYDLKRPVPMEQGRGKKDAKQVAAAAVLEMLLANVSESDFLTPGKAKQARNQPVV